MERILLISSQEVIAQTVLNGEVDYDKFLPNIYFAQEFKLEPLIGSELLIKIQTEIDNGSLTDPYLTLNNNYIKPFLAHAAASDYIETGSISVDNGGVSRYQPDNGNQATTEEIVNITRIVANRGNAYGLKLIKYLKENKSLFPEYKRSEVSGVYFGWQLDENYGC